MEGQLLTFNQKLTQLLANKPVILQILKFAAIGALNTALDFIILNYVTKAFGVESGLNLGLLNVISFGIGHGPLQHLILLLYLIYFG